MSIRIYSKEHQNSATRFVVGGWQLAPATPFETVFLKNYAKITAAYAAAPGPGCVAMAFDGSHAVAATEFLSSDGKVEGAEMLIVGRHERASLFLPNDVSMALRHLMVRYTVGVDGPTLRVCDLKTGQGFRVTDVGLCEAVTATGPLHVTVGAYALLFLPVVEPRIQWPSDAAAGWALLPPWQVSDRRRPCLVSEPKEMPRRFGNAAFDNQTHITVLPGFAEPRRVAGGEPMPADVFAVLTVCGPAGATKYAVTKAQLELGVLLGRYGRCDIGGLHRCFDESVSRVHAVLLREGSKVMVIDTASTNGVLVDGLPTVAGCIKDGAEIELAEGNVIRWEVV